MAKATGPRRTSLSAPCSWPATTAARSTRRTHLVLTRTAPRPCTCTPEKPLVQMRVHHFRARNGRHGSRALRVTERMWGGIFAQAFVGTQLQGIALEPRALPQADEKALLDALAATCIEAIQRQEFGPAMSGDEMLAWLEANFADRRH